jgi:hypothetical protein
MPTEDNSSDTSIKHAPEDQEQVMPETPESLEEVKSEAEQAGEKIPGFKIICPQRTTARILP